MLFAVSQCSHSLSYKLRVFSHWKAVLAQYGGKQLAICLRTYYNNNLYKMSQLAVIDNLQCK